MKKKIQTNDSTSMSIIINNKNQRRSNGAVMAKKEAQTHREYCDRIAGEQKKSK